MRKDGHIWDTIEVKRKKKGLQTAQLRVEGLMANQSLKIRLTELDFDMNQRIRE